MCRKWIVAILFLAIAGFLLYLPSELGVSLAIYPDSNEYSICLANLFEHGRYGFTLNGEWYPSRYLPWFSLLCLSPAYFLSGGDILSMHWAVLAFALAFIVFSYRLGHVAGLGKWSFACAIMPLFIPDFVFYSRMAMTEIPYVALFAASALAFVRFVGTGSPSLLFCLGAGVLVTWCGAARVTALPMLALFAAALLFKKCGWKRKIVSAVLLALPAVVYEIAGLLYNKCIFGNPFRSGYHYWMPIPFDFPDIAFSCKYVAANVENYLKEPMMLVTLFFVFVVAVATVLILRGRLGGVSKNRGFLLLTAYVMFQGAVLSVLYLVYYFSDVRLFLAFSLCLIPLFFAAVAKMADGCAMSGSRHAKGLFTCLLGGYAVFHVLLFLAVYVGSCLYGCLFLLLIALCSVILTVVLHVASLSVRRENRGQVIVLATVFLSIAEFHRIVPRYYPWASECSVEVAESQIAVDAIPGGSVVLQTGRPGLIDYFGRRGNGGGYEHFPYSRGFDDYAGNMTALFPIARGAQRKISPWTLILPEFVSSGACKLPFPTTFKENPERIGSLLKEKRRVFVHKCKESRVHAIDYDGILGTLDSLGFKARDFSVQTMPEIKPNPVRYLYDRFIFPFFSMDSRPEVKTVLYEVLPKQANL